MTKRIKKHVRERGKIKLSKYFQVLKEGQKVVVDKVSKISEKRYRGVVGTILGKQGNAYIIKIKQGNKIKKIIIKPMYLKKLELNNFDNPKINKQ